jgi:hypothetical protein
MPTEGTNLADVDISAVGVDLGVVRHEQGRVDAVDGSDVVACVALLNDVSRRAVLAGVSETEALADLEVVARLVDPGVHDRELVATWQHVSRRNGYTCKGEAYVETLWFCEMVSQMSPSWTV